LPKYLKISVDMKTYQQFVLEAYYRRAHRGTDYRGRDYGGTSQDHEDAMRRNKAAASLQGAVNPKSVHPAEHLKKKVEEELEIEEGVRPTPVEKPLDKATFKKRRRSLAGKEKSAEARGRGHEGKEWYNSGRTYSPDEAKRSRAKLDDAERRTRHRSAVDPDDDNDNNYSADKTKNPKKLRKQRSMGELG
jgi:hypothetical protein